MVPKNKRSSGSELIAMSPGHSQDLGHQRPFMDARELLSSLWREKVYVFLALAAAMALVGLYLLITPNSYTATAQLLIDLNRPLTGEAQSMGADTTRFMMGPVIDSQVEIIRARRIVRRVIETTGYQNAEIATPGEAEAHDRDGVQPAVGKPAKPPSGEFAKPPSGQGVKQPSSEISLATIAKFLQELDVRRKGLTLILLVQFTDRNPELAASVANAIVEEYLADRSRTEQAASKRAVATLTARTIQARKDMDEGEKRLQQLSEEFNLVSAGGTTLDEREVAETATQLNLARAQETKLLADLQQWEAQSKDSTGIATIGKLGDARHNYEVARNQVQLLDQKLNVLKTAFARKSTGMNRYLELQKETQGIRDNYLAMVARIKQLEMEENYSMLDIQMLDNASVPQSPSSPNLPLVLAGGLLGGLGFGITLALIKDHISTVLRTPLLVQSNLGVPHIASLNQLRGRKVDPFGLLGSQPNSPFVQGVVMIHRFLAEIRSGGQRVIAIVSVNDGDGKSTVASALAQYAASITHQKTALVDCDIHQRTLSKRFAPDAPHSFAQALNGTLTPGGVLTDPPDCAFSLCTAPWEDNTLGNIEMLMSPGMTKFVKAIGRDYDLVILDTAGLLKNVETRALISMADIVIMVVDARDTTAEDVAAIRELSPDLEDKLAGVVLNHTV